jgi:hypothetical protein
VTKSIFASELFQTLANDWGLPYLACALNAADFQASFSLAANALSNGIICGRPTACNRVKQGIGTLGSRPHLRILFSWHGAMIKFEYHFCQHSRTHDIVMKFSSFRIPSHSGSQFLKGQFLGQRQIARLFWIWEMAWRDISSQIFTPESWFENWAKEIFGIFAFGESSFERNSRISRDNCGAHLIIIWRLVKNFLRGWSNDVSSSICARITTLRVGNSAKAVGTHLAYCDGRTVLSQMNWTFWTTLRDL